MQIKKCLILFKGKLINIEYIFCLNKDFFFLFIKWYLKAKNSESNLTDREKKDTA